MRLDSLSQSSVTWRALVEGERATMSGRLSRDDGPCGRDLPRALTFTTKVSMLGRHCDPRVSLGCCMRCCFGLAPGWHSWLRWVVVVVVVVVVVALRCREVVVTWCCEIVRHGVVGCLTVWVLLSCCCGLGPLSLGGSIGGVQCSAVFNFLHWLALVAAFGHAVWLFQVVALGGGAFFDVLEFIDVVLSSHCQSHFLPLFDV